MRRVGIREFRDNATKLLKAEEPLAVERHGTTVGYFIPVKKDAAALSRHLKGLEEAIAAIMAETGWTEDELVEKLAPRPERHAEVQLAIGASVLLQLER